MTETAPRAVPAPLVNVTEQAGKPATGPSNVDDDVYDSINAITTAETSTDIDILDDDDDVGIEITPEEVVSPAKLKQWYSTRRPVLIDIVGDFSGHELFVVHGESLIRHVLSQGRVDFDGSLSWERLCN